MASCFLLWRGEWHSCIFDLGDPMKLWSFLWLPLFFSNTLDMLDILETLETFDTLRLLIPLLARVAPKQEFLKLLGLTPTVYLIGFNCCEVTSEWRACLVSIDTLQLYGFLLFLQTVEFKKLDSTMEVTEISVLVDILLYLWLEVGLNWRLNDLKSKF